MGLKKFVPEEKNPVSQFYFVEVEGEIESKDFSTDFEIGFTDVNYIL